MSKLSESSKATSNLSLSSIKQRFFVNTILTINLMNRLNLIYICTFTNLNANIYPRKKQKYYGCDADLGSSLIEFFCYEMHVE